MLNLLKRLRKVPNEQPGEAANAGGIALKESGATVPETAPHFQETVPAAHIEVIEGSEDSDWALWADSVLASEAQDLLRLETTSAQGPALAAAVRENGPKETA